MINNVTLVGRLTKPLDLRYTSNGTAVANFTLAVNRKNTNQNGEREADFVQCVIWRKAAENLANFTKKGSLIGVEGRIQTRSYDNDQQQKVYVTEVVAGSFSLLESKSKNQDSSDREPSKPTQYEPTTHTHHDPFEGNGGPVDIDDDDLPF